VLIVEDCWDEVLEMSIGCLEIVEVELLPPCCVPITAVAAKDLVESGPLFSCFQEMGGNGECNDVLKARMESLALESALELIEITLIL
jgi:hypothetical protein